MDTAMQMKRKIPKRAQRRIMIYVDPEKFSRASKVMKNLNWTITEFIEFGMECALRTYSERRAGK
jgi:hypothetical protein